RTSLLIVVFCRAFARYFGRVGVRSGIVMNFSAEKSSRKLDIGALDRRPAAMVTAAALAFLAVIAPAGARETRSVPPLDLFAAKPKPRGSLHRVAIPLPRPRPTEAPKTEPDTESAEKPEIEKAGPAPPQPSACRLALTEDIAIAPSIPDIKGPGGCGG